MIGQHKNLHSEMSNVQVNQMGVFVKYIKPKLLRIFGIASVFAVIAFFIAWSLPKTYSAKMIFLVEEGKSSSGSLGGLASIAGQFGFDLGSVSGSAGIFSGDNILSFFKSPGLAKEVLLSPAGHSTNKTIADNFVEVYGLQKKWAKKEIGPIHFFGYKKGNRLQDSLLQKIGETIIKSKFNVAKADKKSNFIEVEVTFIDEQLSKLYCERIVELAVKNYLQAKTQRQQATVDNLQRRADSIASLLNVKTLASASLQTTASTIDLNPLFKANTAYKTETTTRDKLMLTTIFGEVVKNLELAKFTLSQETPVIQVIDAPELPLHKNELPPFLVAFSIFIFVVFLSVLLYAVKWQLITPVDPSVNIKMHNAQ